MNLNKSLQMQHYRLLLVNEYMQRKFHHITEVDGTIVKIKKTKGISLKVLHNIF